MARFILFLHDRAEVLESLSGEDMMALIKRYIDWTEKMRAEGRYLGGEKLVDEPGRVLGRRDGKLEIHDGPFAETHEILGGYMMIEAAGYEEAAAIAATCPHVDYGRIELREIEELDKGA